MNQILYNKKIYKKFKIIFFISIIICLICFIIYSYIKYINNQNEKLSKSLVNNFNITTLYANSNYSSFQKLNSDIQDSESEPFVIGLIKIDKINLTYPILSSTTEELLKISPCYFYGPMPNEVGNLCIAGHNYVDNKLFSKLHLLNKNDIVKIYDLSGNYINYSIYDKTEVEPNDMSCTNQNTNGKREITLITCNNVKGTRVIIKAKENEER